MLHWGLLHKNRPHCTQRALNHALQRLFEENGIRIM